MAWRRRNYGSAESDNGVRVTRTGFRTLKYELGDRELTIDVEAGDNDLGVYAKSVDHWDGGDVEISNTERAKILNDIVEALHVLRVPVKLLWN